MSQSKWWLLHTLYIWSLPFLLVLIGSFLWRGTGTRWTVQGVLHQADEYGSVLPHSSPPTVLSNQTPIMKQELLLTHTQTHRQEYFIVCRGREITSTAFIFFFPDPDQQMSFDPKHFGKLLSRRELDKKINTTLMPVQ